MNRLEQLLLMNYLLNIEKRTAPPRPRHVLPETVLNALLIEAKSCVNTNKTLIFSIFFSKARTVSFWNLK